MQVWDNKAMSMDNQLQATKLKGVTKFWSRLFRLFTIYIIYYLLKTLEQGHFFDSFTTTSQRAVCGNISTDCRYSTR